MSFSVNLDAKHNKIILSVVLNHCLMFRKSNALAGGEISGKVKIKVRFSKLFVNVHILLSFNFKWNIFQSIFYQNFA